MSTSDASPTRAAIPSPSALGGLRAGGHVRGTNALLGPAFVAAVAHQRGAGGDFSYLLVWVVVVVNSMAMLVQYLSAKVGVVSEPARTLRRALPRPVAWGVCMQAELIAMATDLA